MFSFMRQPSRSAFGAIRYVTVWVLLMIWAGLWYYYFLRGNPNAPAWQEFMCIGIMLSGLAVTVIGMLFGVIGAGAKGADNTVGVANTTPVVQTMPVAAGVPGTVAVPAGTQVAPPGLIQPTVVR